MKIAVWHNLPSGGGKRALYYQVRALVARGHQLAIWTLDTADHSYLPLSEFAPERIISTDVQSPSSRMPWTRWSRSYSEAVNRMRAFDEACRHCAREIEAGEYDLLFANGTLSYSVPYLMRHLRMKKVLYLQESCRYLYEARPVLPWVASAPEDLDAPLFAPRRLLADYPNLQTLRLQAKQEWLSAQACSRLLVNSYFSRESVLRSLGVDAEVCYLGVDTALFRNLGLPRERFIVGLGSLDSIKGVDLAIKSVALLPGPRPPLVWIANSGKAEYEKTMRTLASSLNVDFRIQKAISDAELVATLNKATLLLYTSRLEPFGFAPLEANACGLPVVGIAEGGIRETVRDGINGFLVDPEARAIARATSQLLEDPALARRIGERGALEVQRAWNVETSVDRLEAKLREVVFTQPAECLEPTNPRQT